MGVKKGYKHTEVGVIPEDWEPRNLHECVRSDAPICYGILMPGENVINGVPVIKVRDITNGVIVEDQLLLTHPKIDAAYSRSRLLGGDVLLTIRGTTGRVAVVPPTLNHSNITQDTARIRPKANTNFLFLYFILQCPAVQEQIVLNTVGQAVKGINIRDVKRIEFPLPRTLAEQEAIASALSDADAWIESLEQLIAKKRQIKQGAMQELLTGKRRLPGFSGKWEMKRLGDVADADPENLDSSTSLEYEFNYISLEDVDCGILQSYSEQVFGSAPSRARRKVRKNDVLVSTVRPNLFSHLLFALNGQHWVCSTGFCVVRCMAGKTNPYFVFSHLFTNEIKEQIECLLTGSNYPSINSGDVKALQIPIPPYDEQNAIAGVLADIDSEIESLESKLSKAREIKQGMMQELLTGRIRLV